MSTIAFVGGGNMARSLIGGLVDAGHPHDAIWVSEPVESQRTALSERFGVNTTESNNEAADVIRAEAPRLDPSGQLGAPDTNRRSCPRRWR